MNFDLREASNLRNLSKEKAGSNNQNEFEEYMDNVKEG